MSDDRRPLAERMSSAAREMENQTGSQSTYEMAVKLAVSNVDGADSAGISIARRRGQIETPAATDDLAVIADRLQYELGEGPCLDAVWEQHEVHSPSLAYDQRWPTWGQRVAQQAGAQSVLSFQLFTAQSTVGALNLYSRSKDGFSELDRIDGAAIAGQVAIAVAAVMKIDSLESALASRTMIGQAVGMVMERYQLTPDRAFAVLGRVASSEERKIVTVARELITTGQLGDSEDPG